MFTGLVLESARVADLQEQEAGHVTLKLLALAPQAKKWALGASVAVNGACLTVVANESALGGRLLSFDVSQETLERTSLGALKSGGQAHIEGALCMGDPLGGHLVSGHVDGLGRVSRREQQGDCLFLEIEVHGSARDRVAPYLVEKGSITVDGVSLTLNSVEDRGPSTFFSLLLIPHTLKVTSFGHLSIGSQVNLEADMLAKFVERQAQYRSLKGL